MRRLRVSLTGFTFGRWRHNRLLMTPQTHYLASKLWREHVNSIPLPHFQWSNAEVHGYMNNNSLTTDHVIKQTRVCVLWPIFCHLVQPTSLGWVDRICCLYLQMYRTTLLSHIDSLEHHYIIWLNYTLYCTISNVCRVLLPHPNFHNLFPLYIVSTF